MRSKKTISLVIAALMLATVSLACINIADIIDGFTDDPEPPVAPIAPDPPVQPPQSPEEENSNPPPPPVNPPEEEEEQGNALNGAGPDEDIVMVHMINGTDQTICYVYLSGSWESDWGYDWLGDDVVYPGDEYFFEVNIGTWDMLATACDGGILEQAYGIGIPATGLTWTVDDPE